MKALVPALLLLCSCSGSLLPPSTPSMPVVVQPLGQIRLLSRGLVEREQLPPKVAALQPPPEVAEAAEAEILDDRSTPFTMEIPHKVLRGERLSFRIHLRSKEQLPTNEVAIEAVGLSKGAVVARDILFLDQILESKVLEEGKKVAFTLTLDSPEMSEYQIRGMWGADAKARREAQQSPVAEAVKNTAEPALLELAIRQIDRKAVDCPQAQCPQLITLFGELSNVSATAVTDIVLAVGLFWREEGQEARFPPPGAALTANEQVVKIPTNVLEPGARKRIRLSIDREVPQFAAGEFIPHARVLESRSIGVFE